MNQYLLSRLSVLVVGAAGLFLGGCCFEVAANRPYPAGLTVEYLDSPIGLDTPTPRLSWRFEAPDTVHNLSQTAYRVLVASSPEKLAANTGDLWDSGRVASHASLNIPYAGAPLATSQRCYWKVCVWPNNGKPAWSAPARWVMGILRPSDWTARWIGPNAATRPDYDMGGAQWIAPVPAEKLAKAPAGFTRYRRTFTRPAPADAVLAIAADDSFQCFLNGSLATKWEGHINSPRQIRFISLPATFFKAGTNTFVTVIKNNAEGATGLLLSLRFADGLRIISDSQWQFQTIGAKDKDACSDNHTGWNAACSVAAIDENPWGRIARRQEFASPAFEKAFTVSRPVREAILHITGVGYYEAWLNGSRIGDKELDPAVTRYDRRVLYSTYLLDHALKPGANTLRVLVGHGWYDLRTFATWNFDIAPWRNFPRLIAQLDIHYADGTIERVASGVDWRQVASPVGYDCIRQGEILGAADPRQPDFEKTRLAAELVPGPGGVLTAEAIPPTRVIRTLAPAAILTNSLGGYTLKFPENFAGRLRLTVRGQKAGDIIKVRYGETLDPATATLNNQSIAMHFFHPGSFSILPDVPGGCVQNFQTDRFVCDGSPAQTFCPRFVYHGFQFAEITGLARAPAPADATAEILHNDFKIAGSFACSDPTLNTLVDMALRAYCANFVNGYPTDCPHREKNGWTGDASLASELGQYFYQNVAAYAKWNRDLCDEQDPQGNLPGIVPSSGWGYRWGNGPVWDSALTVIPWNLYSYQGDRRVLEAAYPSFVKYLAYTSGRSSDGIARYGLGDWVPANEKSMPDIALMSTAYYLLSVRITRETAALLGKREDEAAYAALEAKIRAAVQAKLHRGNGVYDNGSQTAQAVALRFGLVPAELRAAAEAHLVETVEKANRHPTFGILGSKHVLRALSDAGRSDLALALVTAKGHPSFSEWIDKGGTTLWEDWDNGSSKNHIMFGDFAAWCMEYLAGIRLPGPAPASMVEPLPAACAFKHVLIAPEFVSALSWVKGSHESPYGTITSEWRREGKTLTLKVGIPPNTTATIRLPDQKTVEVGSGIHTFTR